MDERISDITLLRTYLEGSPAAFAELVGRYITLVYSAATRQVRDRHLAEDVTQAVFVILARKARGLPADTVLGAWLWQVTRLTARAAVRRERRLKVRERKAAELASAKNDRREGGDAAWNEIGPLLDDAVARLGERDRHAIVLRFFEGRSLREVGEVLGTSEDAAKQRTLRALAKLRTTLMKRGAASGGATALAVALTDHATAAVPPGLTEIAANGAASVNIATNVGAIAKGAMGIMACAKAKIAAMAAAAVILLGGTALVAVKYGGSHSGSARDAAAPAQPAVAATTISSSNDWRVRFDAVYRLEPAEVLKRVAPPFIPERESFLSAMDPIRRFAVSNAGYRFGWNNSLAAVAGPMQAQTLASTLTYTLGVPAYRVEFGGLPRGMRLSGDWLVRDNASEDDRLAALAKVLARDWDLGVRFEKQRVTREVVVARGRWTTPADQIVCLYERDDAQRPGTVEGDEAKFLASLAELLDGPVIDESDPAARAAKAEWRYGGDVQAGMAARPDAIDAVLANVTRQTGLVFVREPRPVDVWFIRKP